MYCKVCDREVSDWHRCFLSGKIKPLKNKPNPNTPLARKLAKIYQNETKRDFPNGIGNAQIKRLAQEGLADCGAWKGELCTIEGIGEISFGSDYPATLCAKCSELEFYWSGNEVSISPKIGEFDDRLEL